MKMLRRNVLILLCVIGSFGAQAQHVAVFCGGEMYNGIEQNASTMKLSGFNTVILWSVHIMTNGDFVLNDSKIIADGEYVGIENWPEEVKKLKEQPTSVNRIEFSVGAWSVPDFENIEELIKKEGTGENSVLYRNFKKLKEITGADAIDYDDESNYDVNSTVQLSQMLIGMGYKITLCPYRQKSFWQSVYNQVLENHPNAIDCVYLQCYAGGAANTPASWNDLFDGIKVTPGLWCSHGVNCSEGLDWRSVKHKLSGWRSGIEGGFMWSFDGILQCSIGGNPDDYAKAIRDVMGMESEISDKALQPTPANGSVEISVDNDLSWLSGSWDAKHKVYLGTDSVLTENNLQGTATQSKFEPGTLKNASTYYWRIDEMNDAGTVIGDVWQFATEEVTLLSEKSYSPQPADGADNPSIWSSLCWAAGKGSVKHNVYFGTSNPPPFIGEQKDTIYQPERLLTKTKYYWRIDEANSAGVTVGDVWTFSIENGNIAPEAEVMVSSEYADPNWSKEKLVDGIVKMNGKGEWASDFETYPWVKLTWDTLRTINKVVLYDRPHSGVAVYRGTLTFSDGTSIEVGELPNNGDALEVNFESRQVTWLKFQVDESPGSTTGLAEIEVYESKFPVGVAELDVKNLSVYPNPASDGIFYLDIPTNLTFQFQVYNISGEIVKYMPAVENNDMVDVKDLPHGIYLIRLWNTKKVFTAKVLR